MKMSVWITPNCNMSCTYCYEKDFTQAPEVTNQTAYIKKLLVFINDVCTQTQSKTLYLKLFGGEPLLKFDYMRNVIEAVETTFKGRLNIKFSVTTNGTLMNDDIIQWFEDKHIECALSIDGNESTHNQNRKMKDGSYSWEILDNVICKLLKKNINLSARMTFDSTTYIDLFENIVYLANRGFRRIKAVPNYFDIEWSGEHLQNLEKQLKKILIYQKDNPHLVISIDKEKMYTKKKGCIGGYGMFSIDTTGSIYPCTYVIGENKFKLGNIENPYISVKPSEASTELRKECEHCNYYDCCKVGSCLFGNYAMTGQLNKCNKFFCEYQKIIYKILEE